GLAYRPGSNKAKLAVRGIRQMVEFCQSHSIPHDICGKLVVATREEQLPRLTDLFQRGSQNGLRGLEILDGQRMREIEPHVAGVAALRVPEEGIVDYPAVCEALRGEIEARGGKVVTNAGVTGLRRNAQEWRVETRAGDYAADVVVTCAGLQADRVAKLAGIQTDVQIVPFRGDYYKLRPEREFLVRNLIYPVADPKFPFLGLHFTRMIRGGIEAGPNAVLALKREGYSKIAFNLRDAAEALTFPGLWRFVGQHAGMCVAEVRRAFSKALFCRSLQQLVPAIEERDLAPGGSGVRAQAMRPDGRLVEDFEIVVRERAVHVLNAPSPAATAALAIGEEVAALALAQ
ncbi:MAG: L-2-hydroxyglutarate oxidase, partial [Bryobacteraceae bacterium]